MPETPQAQPAAPTLPTKRTYTLKYEPIGEFSETELFVKGVVRAKFWLSDGIVARLKSLTGEDVDKVNDAVKATPQMTVTQYNTEITYHNLAHSLEAINDTIYSGSFEDRLKKVRAMASAVLGRLTVAYLEFNDHVDELFAGKGGSDLAKKS
jgi:glutamine cyclotransferase